MKVKLLNEDAKIPTSAYEGDAGLDVYSPYNQVIEPFETKQVKLGIAIEINSDEVAVMSERSSQAITFGITSIGNIIDSNYRGEISIILFNSSRNEYFISKGDKIGQIIVHKLGNRNVETVHNLSNSERGDKAHNSSGK